MRTDDTTKRQQQPSLCVKVAITREQSLSTNQNPRERGWKPIEAVSFRCIATVEQLQLEHTHTHAHTHTHTVSFN